MFDAAELGHHIDKAEYKAAVAPLREALLDLQYEMKQMPEGKSFPVVILIDGLDGAGKGETVNLLNEWMDPRLIHTHAFGDRSPRELDRPEMWRYWLALPPKGRIGIMFGSWYSEPMNQRVEGKISTARLDQAIDGINRFERMLCSEGVLLLKFWFHLTYEAQKKRLKELQADPKTRWRVQPIDWENLERHAKIRRVAEHVLHRTSSAQAPWVVVDGSDPNYRALTVGQMLKSRIALHVQGPVNSRVDVAPLTPPLDGRYLLDTLQLNQAMDEDEYAVALEKWQGRLARLIRTEAFRKHSIVAVFEGHDAAGKGGAIRRISAALDARQYRVVPIAAPTEEERAQPYLWRFWRQLPPRGNVTIFDRSWYGRVLVERVEGFCPEADWMRAYEEINDFERQLCANGVILVKFWLAIDRDEQLRRFEEREGTGFKRYKITPEDWRNREKWDQYAIAIHDMVDRTGSTEHPWTLVEANNKRFARIKVLKVLCEAIERKIGKAS